MRFNKKLALILCIVFVSIGWHGVMADRSDISGVDLLIMASKARAAIVKKVQNAVVHIRVIKFVQKGSNPLNTPNDLYNDKFFERFFPGQRPPQSQKPDNERFRQEGMGSGSILSTKGYILTNNHVVGKADKIFVKLNDGREFEAKLVGTDPPSDLAVIKIEGKKLPIIPIGNSDDVDVGESVIAIGNPFGLLQTVTYGIISAKGRSNIGITEYEDFIQTDAAINPGNSGGPLINLKGEIIGVNTAIFTRSGAYNGIGFTVPMNMAQQIMNDLITKGTVSRGWLGVQIQDVDSDIAKKFGLENTNGSVITGVFVNTPAEVSGMKVWDIVIALNGKPIKNSNQFRNKIALARTHSTIEITLRRKGKIKKINVTLGERPKDPTAEQKVLQDEEYLGIVVEDLTPEKAKELGYDQEMGALISEVKPGSPAAKSGLRAGLLIKEIDRKVINSANDFKDAISEANEEEGVLFLIYTKEGSSYIIVSDNSE